MSKPGWEATQLNQRIRDHEIVVVNYTNGDTKYSSAMPILCV